MDTLTSTTTKSISNTKLAIATLAMIVAGSAAFAVMAMPSRSTSDKWGGCVDLDNQYFTSTPFHQDQLFNKGQTKYKSGSKTDYCYTYKSTGKTYLMEGVCSAKGSFSTWQKNCAELNTAGFTYQCLDGACVTASSPKVTCSDSDFPIIDVTKYEPFGQGFNKDEIAKAEQVLGQSIYTKGFVTFDNGIIGPQTNYDKCSWVNNDYSHQQLMETVCLDLDGKGNMAYQDIRVDCTNGCNDGVCLGSIVIEPRSSSYSY